MRRHMGAAVFRSRLKTTREQRDAYRAHLQELEVMRGQLGLPESGVGPSVATLNVEDACADADLAEELEMENLRLRAGITALGDAIELRDSDILRLTEMLAGTRGALSVCENSRVLLQLENTSLSTQLAEIERARRRGYPAGVCGHLGNHVTPDPSMDFCSTECEECHDEPAGSLIPCVGVCGKAVPY